MIARRTSAPLREVTCGDYAFKATSTRNRRPPRLISEVWAKKGSFIPVDHSKESDATRFKNTESLANLKNNLASELCDCCDNTFQTAKKRTNFSLPSSSK
jgi:hypothetical protein